MRHQPTFRRASFRSAARQSGATLVIALLILVLIMMIGITAVSTSNTQFKLAGNLQFEDSALNNAEVAVAQAERWLVTQPAATGYNDPGFTTYSAATPGLLPSGYLAALAAPANNALTMTWGNTNSVVVGGPEQRYFIEKLGSNLRLQGASLVKGGRCSAGANAVNTYLITGRGTSPRGAVKFVQSYYGRSNNSSC